MFDMICTLLHIDIRKPRNWWIIQEAFDWQKALSSLSVISSWEFRLPQHFIATIIPLKFNIVLCLDLLWLIDIKGAKIDEWSWVWVTGLWVRVYMGPGLDGLGSDLNGCGPLDLLDNYYIIVLFIKYSIILIYNI